MTRSRQKSEIVQKPLFNFYHSSSLDVLLRFPTRRKLERRRVIRLSIMLSLKIGRCLSRRLPAVVTRVPEYMSHVPLAVCSHTNTAVARRRYSSDDSKDDKFIESEKYKVFRDDESSVILDVEEERALLESRLSDGHLDSDEDRDQFAGLNTSREWKHGKIR